MEKRSGGKALETTSLWLGGRKSSQAVSESAADLKARETAATRHTSLGDVREMMLAMQPSGSAPNGDVRGLTSSDMVGWIGEDEMDAGFLRKICMGRESEK